MEEVKIRDKGNQKVKKKKEDMGVRQKYSGTFIEAKQRSK